MPESAYIIPLVIFISRVTDVTVGTLRIIFVSRGLRLLAVVLGFFEITIWLGAMGLVMANLTNVWNFLAYAAGFATGNFIGMTIEQKIRMGTVVVRVIINRDRNDVVNDLYERGYRMTHMDAEGKLGPVKVLFLVMKRRLVPRFIEIINETNPGAFYTVEDVRFVGQTGGLLVPSVPGAPPAGRGGFLSLSSIRKAK